MFHAFSLPLPVDLWQGKKKQTACGLETSHALCRQRMKPSLSHWATSLIKPKGPDPYPSAKASYSQLKPKRVTVQGGQVDRREHN